MFVLGHLFNPRRPFLSLNVNEVVKNRALRGELDSLELGYPPFGELNTIINKLYHRRIQEKANYIT